MRTLRIMFQPRLLPFVSFALIFLMALGLHLATTYHPIGSEAMYRWIAHRLFLEHGTPLPLNEHTLRWGMNMPLLAVQWLFASAPTSYYFAPVLWLSLSLALLWECGRRLGGGALATIAILPTLMEPLSFYAASTPMPSAFGMAYMLGGILLMIISFQRNNHLLYFLAACALFFLSYGAKVTNVFFLMGLFPYLLLSGRRRLFIYGAGMLLALLFVETLIVNSMSGFVLSFGRIEVLASSEHMNNMMGRDYGLVDLFARWFTGFSWPSRIILYAGLGAMILIVFKRRFVPPELIAIAWGGLVFAVLTTFGITSLHPLRFMQEPVPRYLLVFMPLAGLAIGGYLHSRLGEKTSPWNIWSKWTVQKGLFTVALLSCGLWLASPTMPVQIGNIQAYGAATKTLSDRGCGFVFFYNGVYQANRGLFASVDELAESPWIWERQMMKPKHSFVPPPQVLQWLENTKAVQYPWLVFMAPPQGEPRGYVFVDRVHKIHPIPAFKGDNRCAFHTASINIKTA